MRQRAGCCRACFAAAPAEIAKLLDSNAALRDELSALRTLAEGMRFGALGAHS